MGRALHFPFQVGDLGVPRTTAGARIIRQQLEQILFTVPAERVNRPEFGCGVQNLVFGGASPEVAAAAEYVVATSVRRHLGALLQLDAVKVSVDESTLYIDILYTVHSTGEERSETFARAAEGVP